MKNSPINLLDYSRNVYSQNGEDGIIKKIFSTIGTTNKFCCEFGAWDGIHFSNTHELIKNQGWGGVQIEADPTKFKDLQKTYGKNRKVTCLQAMVDTGSSSLEKLFKTNKLPQEFDLLSIDIDGLDYYILKTLKLRPRLICIEVNAGHDPSSTNLLPKHVAQENVGQSLPAFCKIADEVGYRLICYSGNAFLLRKDLGLQQQLPTLEPQKAYKDFLNNLDKEAKLWLYKVNRGWVPPYHRYHNSWLSAAKLKLSPAEVLRAHKERLSAAKH